MFIAHRGKVTKYTKENTLDALTLAVKDNKYLGFECDIRQTKDEKFVISHDAIYNNKIIKYNNLIELDNITTLDEVLNIQTSKIMLLEIKDFNMNIEKLSEILNNSHRNIYVMSFSKEVIKRIKIYAKNFKCGIINYILNSESNYSNYDFIALLNSTITKDIINYFTKKNIKIFSYGIINLDKKIPNIYYIVDNYAKYMVKY